MATYDDKRTNRDLATSQGVAVPFPAGLSHWQRISIVRETTDITEDVDYPIVSDLDGESFTPIFMNMAISDKTALSGIKASSIGWSNAFLGGIAQDMCMFATSGGSPIVSGDTILGKIDGNGVGWIIYFAYPDPDPEGILRIHWEKVGAGRVVWGSLTLWGMR